MIDLNLVKLSPNINLGFGKSKLNKAGSVNLTGDVKAGDGSQGDGGNANISAGDGYGGISGGDVNLGSGNYTAGNGGSVGKGGDLNIKAGDAK